MKLTLSRRSWHWRSLARSLSNRPLQVTIAVLAVLPALLPYTSLASSIVIWGLYALGFNLVFGRLGLLSLGHAAFFGAGAYGFGMAVVHMNVGFLAAMACAVGLSTAVALIMGALLLRAKGIYFAMITLALANCVYFIFLKATDWTGGESGLPGADVKSIGALAHTIDLQNPVARYYLILATAAICLALLFRLNQSPLGVVMDALKQSESRAAACGYNVKAVRFVVFVLSAVVCGVAGALYTLSVGTVTIDSLHYWTSSQVLMMAILGGAGTLIGPLIGAGIFVVLADLLPAVTSHWQLFFGLLFMAFVRYCPDGVWGMLRRRLVP